MKKCKLIILINFTAIYFTLLALNIFQYNEFNYSLSRINIMYFHYIKRIHHIAMQFISKKKYLNINNVIFVAEDSVNCQNYILVLKIKISTLNLNIFFEENL